MWNTRLFLCEIWTLALSLSALSPRFEFTKEEFMQTISNLITKSLIRVFLKKIFFICCSTDSEEYPVLDSNKTEFPLHAYQLCWACQCDMTKYFPYSINCVNRLIILFILTLLCPGILWRYVSIDISLRDD